MTYDYDAIVRRIYDDLMTQGRLELIEEVYHPEAIIYPPGTAGVGREQIGPALQMLRTVTPGEYRVHDVFGSGDNVSIRWTLHGRHEGEIFGVAATFKEFELDTIATMRLKDGQVYRAWQQSDIPGFLKQLGVFPTVVAQQRSLEDAFDAVPSPVILADHYGRVLFCNVAARTVIDRSDGLTLTQRRLAGSTPATSAKIAAAINDVLAKPDAKTEATTLSIDRTTPGARPYALEVSAVFPHTDPYALETSFAVIFISDPDESKAPKEASLIALFDLTPREAELCSLLACGEALREAAALMGVSYETSRTHLRTIFDKTGASRQGELIALVRSSVGLASKA